MKTRLKCLSGLASMGILLGMAGFADVILPRPVRAAEEIKLILGGPGLIVSVSVDSLDTFAQTGEINRDLRLLARFLDDDAMATLRQSLQRPIPLNLLQVDNFGYSTMGEDVLENVGKLIRLHPDLNGKFALRGAVLGAAAQAGPDGWTVIDVLRQFPSSSIDIRLRDILELLNILTVYFDYSETVIAAIQDQATLEAAGQLSLTPPAFEDLTQEGPYTFERRTVTLTNTAIRQTSEGIQTQYEFPVNAYLPQGLSQPAPVVIISHGFGDVQESFDFVAHHLASYGFVVLAPNHVGSSLNVRQTFLQGLLNTILSPSEFVSRPEEISFLIDELERLVETSPEWAARINPDQIGILGDSLGGTTALGLAGGELDFAYLTDACTTNHLMLNFSLYLQCQARFLPPQNRRLGDPRIKAAIASHPLGGALYGPTGMGQIDIPLLMVVGSQDIVAPVVTEQIYPFLWVQSEQKYLALLTEGTHFTAKPGRDGAEGIFALLAGQHREIGTRYFKALTVAFVKAHLHGERDYLPYLSARYGQWLSDGEPLALDIVQSLQPTTLTANYSGQPPIPLMPTTATPPPTIREESVLAQIQRTGMLKVAFRKDSAPFGYIDGDANWVGYCRDFANELQGHVSQTLGQSVDVDLMEMPSTLANRFALVQNDMAHLECGPNTIQLGVEAIAFSKPLFVTGVQFLVEQDADRTTLPNPFLEDVRVAVLPETTTEQFVRDTFPDAEVITFPTDTGRSDAIDALASGEVDVVASDGILAVSELSRQGRAIADFTLVPERPLTCEFYGLILPADDPDWQQLINTFIDRTHFDRLSRHVPTDLLSSQVNILDNCLN